MNEATLAPPMGADQPFVERYETLRRDAICRGMRAGSSGQGMALVLHKGLTAWMQAWMRWMPPVNPPVPRPSPVADRPSAPDLATTLVQMLTTMACAAIAARGGSPGDDRLYI